LRRGSFARWNGVAEFSEDGSEMGMLSEKAYLWVEGKERIECMFNPSELSFSVSASWDDCQAKPGQSAPQLQFSAGQAGTMTLNLFFDTTNSGKSVTTTTNKIINLTKVDPGLSGFSKLKNNGRPPVVTFHWGRFRSFESVVTSVEVNYVHFSKWGDPLRARVAVTLKQFADDSEFPAQNPTSGTPAPQRSHLVQPGETLDRIAWKHYGDATKWRAIAAANQVRDPFSVRPGTMIDIPTVDT
jgi:hypothetical protein